MRVFLSWSGVLSHKVALLLKDWLPSVIQATEPYVSSEDIDKGTRWSSDIATELKECSFGILCVTHENLEAPWLNFEAGALSKTFANTFVVPFLIDLKRSDVHGPILQFQSTIYDKEDIKKLLVTINNATPEKKLDSTRLDSIFDMFWPILDEKLKLLIQEATRTDQAKKQKPAEKEDSKSAAILEELLDLARKQHKILNSQDSLKAKSVAIEMFLLQEDLNTHLPALFRLFRRMEKLLNDIDNNIIPGPLMEDIRRSLPVSVRNFEDLNSKLNNSNDGLRERFKNFKFYM